MELPSKFGYVALCLRGILAGACSALLVGCQTRAVVLSPPMHARVVDGRTGKPLDQVRVTLTSLKTPQTATGYTDRTGFVDLPGLLGQDNGFPWDMTETPPSAVHAVFQRRGYESYTIDSLNGYHFFKGTTDVRLFPD